MRRALIGGIGNVLLGDDGVGPFVVRLLESQYSFGDDIKIVDLGTPALDLVHQIVGLDSLILVDSVAREELAGTPPGTIVRYRREDIIRETPAQRLDPHSPALSECLLAAEMLGASPQHVLLVGVVGKSFEPGEPLTPEVQQAVSKAMESVLAELALLGFNFQERAVPIEAGIWWYQQPVHS